MYARLPQNEVAIANVSKGVKHARGCRNIYVVLGLVLVALIALALSQFVGVFSQSAPAAQATERNDSEKERIPKIQEDYPEQDRGSTIQEEYGESNPIGDNQEDGSGEDEDRISEPQNDHLDEKEPDDEDTGSEDPLAEVNEPLVDVKDGTTGKPGATTNPNDPGHDPEPTGSTGTHTTSDQEAATRLAGRCAHWPHEVRSRFLSECGYWARRFERWETGLHEKDFPVRYECASQKLCHGWGDRVAGMEMVFFKALGLGKRFEVQMSNVKSLFHTCMFQKPLAAWDIPSNATHRRHPPAIPCVVSNMEDTDCSKWLRVRDCHTGPLVARNPDRTCMADGLCKDLARSDPNFNVVNLFGCGMRAMLEPSAQLLSSKFNLLMDGKNNIMALRDVHELMKQYYVIAIHMRLGDEMAFLDKDQANVLFKKRAAWVLRPFFCASTIEHYVTNGTDFVNGRRVKYFLASDSYHYRQFASENFGDRLMILDFKPSHIAFGGAGTDLEAMIREVGEWLTLGKADQLLMNRIGLSDDIYKGRPSGFSYTSWLYQLKNEVYHSGTCRQHALALEGVFSEVLGSCAGSAAIQRANKRPQPHMDILRQQGLRFPEAYIDRNGRTVRVAG